MRSGICIKAVYIRLFRVSLIDDSSFKREKELRIKYTGRYLLNLCGDNENKPILDNKESAYMFIIRALKVDSKTLRNECLTYKIQFEAL